MQLLVGDRGSGNCDQVADALHVLLLFGSLGGIQLVLVKVDGASQGHNAVVNRRLNVVKFLIVSEFMRDAGLNRGVIASRAGRLCEQTRAH